MQALITVFRPFLRLVSQARPGASYAILGIAALLCGMQAQAQVSVVTQHNDNARTGQNLNETVLNSSNVSVSQFGKLFTRTVSGDINGQPLYLQNVAVPSQGTHNVVYVATSNNNVYAFDADNAAASSPLWSVNLGATATGAEMGANDASTQSYPAVAGWHTTGGTYGVQSTPVIDPSTGTIYVCAAQTIAGQAQYVLHGLDTATGAEKFGGPATITGSVSGTGEQSVGGILSFHADRQLQRPGLLLANGMIYIGFGGHADMEPLHGWVIAYNAGALGPGATPAAVFCSTPNGARGAIWQSGQGLSSDASGNVFAATGDGTFDANTGGFDYGDSILQLTSSLALTKYFTPFNQNLMAWYQDTSNNWQGDLDLGSSCLLLIPGSNLAFQGSKDGKIYEVDRTNLSWGYSPSGDSEIVDSFQAGTSTFNLQNTHQAHDLVYWYGPSGPFVYVWPDSQTLQAYQFSGGTLVHPTSILGPNTGGGFADLSLSANGSATGTGILWASTSIGPDLRAYDASNVATALWNSTQNSARDGLPSQSKWANPTVANGRVYVATTSNQLVVYGLLGLYPPTALRTAGGGGVVSLSWNSSPGNTSYNVKRSTISGGPYTTIASGITDYDEGPTGSPHLIGTYLDLAVTNGTPYYYVVTAVNASGESVPTTEIAATPTAPATTEAGIANATLAPPTIDGDPSDVVWTSASSYPFRNAFLQVPSSPADLSGNFKAAWDSTNLYVLFSVTNAIKTRDSVNQWDDSDTELYIDTTNSRASSYGPQDFEYSFRWNDSVPWEQHGATTGVVYAFTNTPTGYYVEAKIPWTTLGMTPALNQVIGLDAAIAYDDDGGPRDGRLAWIDNNNDDWHLPSIFGTGRFLAPGTTPPTGLTATAGDTQVGLNWTTVSGATSYNVKSATTNGGPYTTIASPTTNSYTNTGLTDGTTYYYIVSAVNATGESGNSAQASATPTAGLTAPANLRIAPGGAVVSLSWDAPALATSYNVKRSTVSGGPYTVLATGVANYNEGTKNIGTFSDLAVTNGTAYYYVVSAVNSGGEGPNSAEAGGTPTAPSTSEASIIGTSAAPVIDGNPSDAVWAASPSYPFRNVYLRVPSSSADFSGNFKVAWDAANLYALYSITDDVKWNDSTNPWDDDAVELCIDTTNSRASSYGPQDFQYVFGWNDTVVWEQHNQTAGVVYAQTNTSTGYFIEVQIPWSTLGTTPTANSVIGLDAAVDDDDDGGVRDSHVAWIDNNNDDWHLPSIFGTGRLIPAPPTAPAGLTATSGDTQVSLAWSAATGATSYNVKRSAVTDGPYTTIASPTTASYTNTGLTNGATYYYVVSAVNLGGESANSAQASATPLPPPPAAPTGVLIAPGRAINTLSWNMPATAATFNVKRATVTGGPYTNIATGVAPYNTGTQNIGTYTDTGLTNGTAYYYVVSAVNIGGEGANSTEVTGTPQALATTQATILATATPPTIDGSASDAIWASAPSYSLNNVLLQVPSSPADFSASYQAAWDANNLYILFTVNDDSKINDSTNPWDDDAVELFIDADGNRSTSYDSNDFQYVFGWNDTTAWEQHGHLTGVTFAKTDQAGGYMIEISIPWTTLTVTPAANAVIGIDAAADNDDDGGPRDTHISWMDQNNNAWHDPTVWGTGVLIPLAPSAPAGLTATAGDTQVALSWTASSGATSYNIKRATVTGGPYSTISSPTGSSYTDTGLTDGTTYFYVVSAVNTGGESANSTQASAMPVPPIPVVPAGLTATAGDTQVTLSWTASSGATSYNVKRATVTGGPYSTVSSPTGASYTDTGLTNGTTYYYVVSAVNLGGESANSSEASARPLPPIPASPTGLTATAGDTQVTLSWTVSSGATSYSVKRATITGGPYTIVSSPTGASYTDTGLTNGTTYYYVVSAVNLGGESANSSEASARPLPPIPAAPTGLTATAGDTQVTLAWTASSGVTSYNVKCSTVSGGPYAIKGSPTTASFTNTGLTNGTTYYYVVSAVNLGGESANSSEASARPLPPIPAPPTGLTATPGNAQVAISWTAATGATSYNVKRATVTGGPYSTVSSPTGASYTDTGLTNGTTYYYVVSAVNLGGESANSSEASARPLPPIPSAPTGLTATAGDTQVTLAWTAATGATSYNVKRATVTGGPYTTVYSPTSANYTDTGLTNGTTYYYVVSAVNLGGESANSSEASARPLPPIPAVPSGLTATPGNTQVALSWTASSGATSYNVKRATVTGGPYTTVYSPTSANYTDTGLTNGTTYYYVVSAVNLGGESGNSSEASARPLPPIPSAPTGLTATAGDTQVTLAWTASSGATSYNVKCSTVTGGPYAIKGSPTTANFTNTGLANGTTYYYVVSAVNLGGESANSSEASARPLPPIPAVPTGLTATPGNAQVALSWATSAGTTSYNVKRATVTGGPYTGIASPTISSYTDTGLTNGTTYYYVVSAVNLGGESANSSEASARPLPPIPAAPTGLTATPGNAQVALSWTASTGATSYNVKRSTINGSGYATVASPTATSVTNTGLTNGTTYYYVVTAVNLGGESANSSQASAMPVPPVPGVPTGLTAAPGNAQAALSWTASSGATSYNAKRSTVNGSGYATVAGPTTNSYTDTGLTNGITYYYVVSAVNLGGESGNSTQASAAPVAPPAAPAGLIATPGNTQVALSWTASTGATTYNVLRSTVSGSGYVSVVTGLAATNYTNTGLVNGTTYYFVVSATNAGGTSANSTQASATPQPPVPAVPTGLIATPGAAQVALTWTASSGATSYNVKRSTVNGSGYATVASPTAANYTNTGLTVGTTYYYVVSAVNGGGESANSSQAGGTAKGTVTKSDTADAYIRAGTLNTGTNFGTSVQLISRKAANNGTNASNYCTYMKFDLTSVTTAPTTATLNLTVNSASSPSTSTENVQVYYVANTTWTETGITWNNAPGFTPSTFASTGTLLTTKAIPLTAGGTTVDLTSFVAAHLGQVVTLQFMDATAQNISLIFNSKEAATGQPSLSLVY